MQSMCVAGGENQNGPGILVREAARHGQEVQSVPMFRSLEAALSFAYLWRACAGVKIGEIKEYTGKEGGAIILSASERKAQAGLMLAVIESHLSIDQRALLDATHGGENGERAAGIDRLIIRFESLNRNRSLIRNLLMREFIYGERYCPSQNRVARECGVNPMTASRVAAKIAPDIADLRLATMEKLRPAFERRGWISREEAPI